MTRALLTLLFTSLLMLGNTLGIDLGGSPSMDDLSNAVQLVQQADPANPTGLVQYKLAAGEKRETEYYVWDTGVDGPTIMVVAGLHGDEPAAVDAANDLVQKAQTLKGRVVILPRAHAEAVAAGKRYFSTDLNREFPKTDTEAAGSKLAADIWGLVKTYKPDWLVDLHDEYSTKSGQMVVYTKSQEDAAWAATSVVNVLNEKIEQTEAKFAPMASAVPGSLARSAADLLGVRTLLVETRQQFLHEARRDQLVTATLHLLTHLGMF